MSANPHNTNPAMSGANPDYYAETASVAGDASSGQPQHQQQPQQPQQQPPQYQEGTSNVPYYPPPPGPPPSGQQEYYAPPPQAPPHFEGPPSGSGSCSIPPPTYADQPNASSEYPEEKPPAMPPRPLSGQPQQQQGYYFPPPPSQPSSSDQPPQQQQQQPHPPSGDDAKKKKTFGERFYELSTKMAGPVNKLTNKLGSEAFWPTSLDKECDKAARILNSFCKDGFYTKTSDHPQPSPGSASSPGPSHSSKALVKIPPAAIQTAKGLAIFTTFRTGLHISGAGGSGVIVARLPDGSWSPPSGFLIHTLGAGFMIGLDIYDCVCVLRTDEAVRAFTRPRVSLGGEVGLVAGPVGAGTALEAALGASTKPVWSYMKSRGLYAGVQADGTIIVQRPDANAAFYGEKNITVDRILRGEVPAGSPSAAAAPDGSVMWPQGARQLMEVLKSSEGKKADERIVEEVGRGPTPGDLAVTPPEEEAKK